MLEVTGLDAGYGAVQVLHGLTVACGEGAVEVLEAQREGKRALPVSEFLRGAALPGRLD